MTYSSDSAWFIVPDAISQEHCRLMRIGAAGQPQLLRGSLPFPFLTHWVNRGHAIDGNWVVGVRPGPRAGEYVPHHIVRARIEPSGKLKMLPEIPMPKCWSVKCLLLHGDWLYVGGGYDSSRGWNNPSDADQEFLQRVNLNKLHPVLEPVPLPVSFATGKAIDDLLRDGDELLAVDDIVYPKYLFAYQLQPDSQLPVWQWTHQLPFRRSYEHITRASWSEEFIVLLSKSVSIGGVGTYVSVLRRSDFKPVFIGRTHWYNRHQDDTATNPTWTLSDAALQDNQLLLACGSRGLARIRLHTRPLWPKRRESYYTYGTIPASDHSQDVQMKRKRKTVLAEGVDLDKAGLAEGVEWLPLAAGQPPIETLQFIGPGQLLLTGRYSRKDVLTFWVQQLPA